jgi:hypothetical protein
MQAVEERVCDQAVLALLRAMLRAKAMSQDGQVRRPVTGTPQGGVISPLLANVYLHRVDRAWDSRQHGVLVRYADDVLVMCVTRAQAEAALARLRSLLAELGLGGGTPVSDKSRMPEAAVCDGWAASAQSINSGTRPPSSPPAGVSVIRQRSRAPSGLSRDIAMIGPGSYPAVWARRTASSRSLALAARVTSRGPVRLSMPKGRGPSGWAAPDRVR